MSALFAYLEAALYESWPENFPDFGTSKYSKVLSHY